MEWNTVTSDETAREERGGSAMNESAVKIRLMKPDDFEAIVRIDERILKVSRRDAYKLKFERLVESADYVPTSLVAENKDGKVVGFVMGVLYIGTSGETQEKATMDVFGIDPDYQHKGIGKRLINEFVDHIKSLGIHRINMLVHWDDAQLVPFLSKNMFKPTTTINLVREL